MIKTIREKIEASVLLDHGYVHGRMDAGTAIIDAFDESHHKECGCIPCSIIEYVRTKDGEVIEWRKSSTCKQD